MTAKYSIIYPDPPWYYAKRKKGTKFGGGACSQYPLMKDEELLAMAPMIDDMADKNCLMPMWATGARLDFAVELGKAWGFRYCSLGWVWVKTDKSYRPRKMPGTYTSQSVELLLLFARGSIPKPSERMTLNVVRRPVTKHSRKPAFFRREIERLWPTLDKRIELFSRHNVKGWDAWGNEAGKFDNEAEQTKLEIEGQGRLF